MPRFRYSLRFLLVLITVLCLYLGYAENWNRQRREFLSRPDVKHHESQSLPFGWPQRAPPKAPWPIRILGEPGVNEIQSHESDREEAERLFPEAIFEAFIIDEPL